MCLVCKFIQWSLCVYNCNGQLKYICTFRPMFGKNTI